MTRLRGWLAVALIGALGACGGKESAPASAGEGPAAATAEPTEPAAKQDEAPPAAKVVDAAVAKVDAMKVYDLAKLQERIKGSGAKVTLVAVWATWCMPCIEEMPVLDAYYAKHKADGFSVVGLCTDDRADQAEKIQAVLDRTKVTYEQGLLTPGGEDDFFKGVGQEWDGQLPKGVVFDASGKPVASFSEAITPEALDKTIGPLLAK
ncbi:MAG: TlpA family protein disulfide reductase [Deltaproteobacteria bacterium]|nr:MAG: TlpA family protein disulfide reductase [Deltaproteobacteria bacterium]